MEQQRARARAAQKKSIVRALDLSTDAVTEFLGFDTRRLRSPPFSKSTNRKNRFWSSPTRPSSSPKWAGKKAMSEPQKSVDAQAVHRCTKNRQRSRPHFPRRAAVRSSTSAPSILIELDQRPPPRPHRSTPYRDPPAPLGTARSRLSRCDSTRLQRHAGPPAFRLQLKARHERSDRCDGEKS